MLTKIKNRNDTLSKLLDSMFKARQELIDGTRCPQCKYLILSWWAKGTSTIYFCPICNAYVTKRKET